MYTQINVHISIITARCRCIRLQYQKEGVGSRVWSIYDQAE